MSSLLPDISALTIHKDGYRCAGDDALCLGCQKPYCNPRCKALDAADHLMGRQDATDTSKARSKCEMIFEHKMAEFKHELCGLFDEINLVDLLRQFYGKTSWISEIAQEAIHDIEIELNNPMFGSRSIHDKYMRLNFDIFDHYEIALTYKRIGDSINKVVYDLEWFSKRIRGKYDIVLPAIEKNAWNILFASSELRNNYKLVSTILSRTRDNRIFRSGNISQELQKDPRILEIVRANHEYNIAHGLTYRCC